MLKELIEARSGHILPLESVYWNVPGNASVTNSITCRLPVLFELLTLPDKSCRFTLQFSMLGYGLSLFVDWHSDCASPQ
jgi:hypothetical protein